MLRVKVPNVLDKVWAKRVDPISMPTKQPSSALLRRFIEREVINRNIFPFWSAKMGAFSVPSLG